MSKTPAQLMNELRLHDIATKSAPVDKKKKKGKK